MDRCAECGFVYEDLAVSDVPRVIRSLAAGYEEALGDDPVGNAISVRPSDEVWSALEYGCHVRDVLLVQRERVVLALVEDTPSFARMYRDERVSLTGYENERCEEVVAEIGIAANLLAKVFEGLSPDQLERHCIYNFPEPSKRTVLWLGRHTVHEASHHLGDVRSVIGLVTSARGDDLPR